MYMKIVCVISLNQDVCMPKRVKSYQFKFWRNVIYLELVNEKRRNLSHQYSNLC